MPDRRPTPEPTATLPDPGDVLAEKYRLERVLGRGGMGIVYRAHHELLAQPVGIKLMLPEVAQSVEAVARFLNEARAAARIHNEHVARVMDVGRLANGLPYIVMEFLEGSDLGGWLSEQGTLGIEAGVDYVLQALEAIAEAHSIGIVHRDLKPSNIFLVRGEDGAVRIKVLDFGISKATRPPADAPEGNLTSTNALLGSPSYMSPEQLRDARGVDARADVWAIGVILYEVLSGALPFNGDTVGAVFASILEDQPRPLGELRAELPAPLEAIIHQCLRRNPEERWQSVTELARALEPFASRSGVVSVERIARILPLSPRAAGGAPSSGTGPPPGGGRETRIDAAGRTVAPWHADKIATKRSSGQGAWLRGALGLLVLGAGIFGMVRTYSRARSVEAAPSSASSIVAPAPASTASASSPAAPSEAATADASAHPSASAAPPTSSAPRPLKPAPRRPPAAPAVSVKPAAPSMDTILDRH